MPSLLEGNLLIPSLLCTAPLSCAPAADATPLLQALNGKSAFSALEELLGDVPLTLPDSDDEDEEAEPMGDAATAPADAASAEAAPAEAAPQQAAEQQAEGPGSLNTPSAVPAAEAAEAAPPPAAQPAQPSVSEADQLLVDALKERLAAGRAWETAATPLLGPGQQADTPLPTLQQLAVSSCFPSNFLPARLPASSLWRSAW